MTRRILPDCLSRIIYHALILMALACCTTALRAQGYTFTTLAGTAGRAGSADGTGTAAQFNFPNDVAVDSAGNVYVADFGNSTIRTITSGGVVTTLAGLASNAGSANGTGSAARFSNPAGVAVDSAGNVYVADYTNSTIRKITSGGVVTTLAGTAGSPGSANGTGSAARFSNPASVAVDSAGNVYVADYGNSTIRKVTSDGVVTTLAGTAGGAGSADGAGGIARFSSPTGVAVDSAGNVYVADRNNNTIRKITSGGVVSTLAGAVGIFGSADGTGTAAQFNFPNDVAVDSAGNVYVPDYYNQEIRRITSGGVVTTIAGAVGGVGSVDGTGSAARFYSPSGIAVDSAGNVYVADQGNSTIRKGVSGGALVTPSITTQPASVTVTSGQSATFTVVATGVPSPTYQWQRFSTATMSWSNIGTITVGFTFSGVTTPTLSVNTVETLPGDTAMVRCVVTNAAGSATSNAATLTIGSGLTITTNPSNKTVFAGQSATFDVAASAAVSYQWQRLPVGGSTWASLSNGGSYSGANSATLTVSGTTVAMSGDQFRGLVSNATGNATSSAALLTVNPPLAGFTQQPANVTGGVGQTATFTVVVSGDPTPTLQWQVSTDNGGSWQNVSGATGVTLSISSLSLTQSGRRYRVLATNTAGTSTSSVALLTVSDQAPGIMTQPSGGTFRVGQTVPLAVVAAGAGPFQYRWLRDGVPIATASGANFNIVNVQESDAGAYFVEVTGPGGKTASQSATLVVEAPPRFVQQPLDGAVEKGLNTSFSVVVAGSPTPALQWFARTGSGPFIPLTDQPPYSGTRQAVLRITSADTALDGLQVQLRATNGVGVVDSTFATLRVAQPNTALKIRTQPQSQTVKAGATVRFSVEMEGTGQVFFQWLKDGSAIAGATQSGFSRPGALADNAGGYSVVVRDGTGGIATSNTALLTVVGAVDPTFDPKGGPDKEVTVMLALSEGGYLSAGTFTRVAGIPRAGLVKFRRDGTVVTEFNPGSGPSVMKGGVLESGTVRALVELAAGKFLVVGQFDRFNGVAVPGVVRLDAQGGVDATFNPVLPAPPANDPIELLKRFHTTAMGLNGGGYLLGGQAGIVALTTSGAVNSQALYNTNAEVLTLLQQYNGGIIVGGDFTSIGGSARPRLARLMPDYRMDSAFDVGTGPNSTVQSLLRSPEGWIYVLGGFNSFNGRARPAGVARISPTGRLDENFNPPLAPIPTAENGASPRAGEPRRAAAGGAAARGIGKSVVQPNGGIVLPNALPNSTTATQTLAAVEPSSGNVSTTFDVSVNGAVNAMVIGDNEEVALAGDFTSIAGVNRANVGVVTDDSAGSRMVNLSTRGRVAGGDRNLILGFVIKGPEAMRVLIRGVGPTLRGFGIADPLVRPQLTIFNASNVVLTENRGWRTVADPDGLAQVMKQVGAFDLSSNDDTAVVLNLAPGNYTAQISGQSGGQGIALGEVYAVDHGNSRLINLSVRGLAGTGDDVLIPAFVVTGGSRLLLMRTIGPGLVQFGVQGTLARPSMELRRNGVILQTNQGWTNGFDPAAVQARTPLLGAFPLPPQSVDAVLLTALDAADYTVTARDAGGGTGIALVEIYDANGVEKPVPNQ